MIAKKKKRQTSLPTLRAKLTDEERKDYPDVLTLARDYYGYDEKGDKFVSVTNPNARWDWWQIGGRWTGYFKLLRGRRGLTGDPGLMTDSPKPGYADQCKKGDIDVEGMVQDEINKHRSDYDKLRNAGVHELPRPQRWEDMLAKHGQGGNEPYDDAKCDAARKEFYSQPAVKQITELLPDARFGLDHYVDLAYCDDAQFHQLCRESALTPFALVRDSVWYERGKMGWFACVSNEKAAEQWNEEFQKLWDSLPDDTLVTCIDCHI